MDHERLLLHINDFIVSQLDEDRVNGLGYKGLLPPINTREDYVNFPPALFPFVGTSLSAITYSDESLGQYFPKLRMQVIFSSRESGVDPEASTSDMLSFTRQIEAILIDTIRTERFGLQNDILGADIHSLEMLPSFYTTVQSNRKSFLIAYFNLSLYFSGH